MIYPTDVRRGMLLNLEDDPWLVLDTQSQTPSARGASLIVKMKVRNLKTGQVLTKSFRGNEAIETADCTRKQVQFLYQSGDEFHFMEGDSYEQFMLDTDLLGEDALYLYEGLSIYALFYEDRVISIELPHTVELEVTETQPVMKGASAMAQLKPATMSTGLQVMVPSYITPGEKIRVDTRTKRFVERAK